MCVINFILSNDQFEAKHPKQIVLIKCNNALAFLSYDHLIKSDIVQMNYYKDSNQSTVIFTAKILVAI